ncbi:nuclear pore complex protein NUP98B-like isoform X3 [Solanum dulcamara]|uniref:nuclear pore complex protein NUP98B-like isoform X3 n=1 Tax=Solanum dulcamara TaxID=45834 RepID=UPI002486CB61|nr:nuclear pore complex protein NUP98B-like isoform X3 [Solanum dulcamara]
MSIFSLNNTAPTSSPSFSNMNLFGSTSGIQQTSNSGVFGTITSSPFGSSTSFGGNESTTPLLKSSGFGKSAFGINHEGSRTTSYIATPEIDSTRPGGANIQSICGMQTYQDKSHDELRFEDYQLGDKGTLAFNAAMNATSSQTQSISLGSSTLQTFGKKYDVNSVAKESLMRDANVSDSSILGYPRAPAFGVPSNSHSATPRFDSYSFGQPAVSISGSKGKESTAPLLKSSGFVKSAFGINQKGSRTASYIATPDIDCTIPDGAKIQSICGMQTYKDKSQEELRFEDYQLGDKGQKCGSSCGISGTQGFGIIDNTRPFISPVFNQATVDQLFYSLFPSTFVVERAEVDSLSDEISTATASTPFPKSQSISHIFPPNTSLLNSCGTGSRVESTASDVSFSLWIHSRPFAPLNPSSNSSTTSTFSPLRNPWSLSTSVPLSPCSVSPSTYPLLAKSSAHVFGQKNSFSPTPVLTTGGAPQSTLCLNCLKQSQPTPPGLCNVSSTPLAVSQNTPLFFGPLQPEMTPKVGATLPTTNASHPSTEGASCSEIGQGICQPSINDQQSYFPRIMEVNASPIMPPAKRQPSVQISVEHPNLATSIQYGISSLPVSNNPAPVRRRSALIIRHSSLSQHRLPPQKYKPTSDKPKVPFFMDKENTSGVLRTEVIIIPRENPRDWVRPTSEFLLGADSSMNGMHDRDKAGDKPKLEAEEMHLVNCGDDKDVDGIMPKLQRVDYYTVPPMEELISKEKEEAGFCCHVKDFVVGRHGYGSIKFLGETDVQKLDLDSTVNFNRREVIIYMDESKKPPVGQGLNKPAEITLLNVRCINKSTGKEYRDGPMVNKYRDMLIKKTVEQDAVFVSYDPVEGKWKFRVSHF